MNEKDRQEASFLRTLSSEDAATFLLENYIDQYPVTITHRSWKKIDQIRLAERFIKGQVHATDRAYNDFLSFMSIGTFLGIVEDGLPQIAHDRVDLLSYYIIPSLRRVAKSDEQRAKVENFRALLKSLQKKSAHRWF